MTERNRKQAAIKRRMQAANEKQDALLRPAVTFTGRDKRMRLEDRPAWMIRLDSARRPEKRHLHANGIMLVALTTDSLNNLIRAQDAVTV